jgi:phage shock protein PspC (stress-responsive transcriptional regulator)
MTNQNSQNPDQLDRFFRALHRPGITRPTRGRWFAGVAAGVARRLGVDPLAVRVGFIVFGLVFGAGVAVYLTLWLLLPAEDGTIRIRRALKDGDGPSIALLVVTAISVLGGNGPWWPGHFGGFAAFVGLVAVGVWYFTSRKATPASGTPAPAASQDPFRVEPTTPVPDDVVRGDHTGR